MSFNGNHFIAIDQNALDQNEPLDSFGEMSLYSNQTWLDAHPLCVSWTPRSWTASSPTAFQGIRPYASAGRSTILYVPWVIQQGFQGLDLRLYGRTADAHGSPSIAAGVDIQGELVGVIPRSNQTLTRIPANHPSYPWEVRNYSLNSSQEIFGETVTPLALWIQSERRPEVELKVQLASKCEITKERGYLEVEDNNLLFEFTALRPNSTDQHLTYLKMGSNSNPTSPIPQDFLWAYGTSLLGPVTGAADLYANGYLGESNSPKPLKNLAVSPMGYLQIRSIQIGSRYDAIEKKPSRYLPHEDVEAVDSQRHRQNLDQIHKRKRCVFVGPLGSLGDPEIPDPTGWGPRFERVAGSASLAPWLAAPLELRTDSPTITAHIHVIPIWWRSGHVDVERGKGEIPWEVALEVIEIGSGAVLASQIEQFNLTTYPTLCRGDEPFLTQEDRLSQTIPSISTIPFKEGQLFEVDLRLVQLISISLPITHSFSASPFPLGVRLRARIPVSPSAPPPPIAGLSTPPLADFGLVCVGWTLWEAP